MPQETTKEGMRKHVEHLKLDVERPAMSKWTHFLYEGKSVTIGAAPPAQLGKEGRDHIYIPDPSGKVAEIQGRVYLEKGVIYYENIGGKGTKVYDASGNESEIKKGEKYAIDPSWRLELPNKAMISLTMQKVEIDVIGPEQVKAQPQIKKNELEEITKMAGGRSAEVVKTFIDHISNIIEKEREAGKQRIGIDHNMNYVKGGMWVEGSLAHLPKEGQAIIVGDIHSRPDCLEHILKETNFVERASKGEKLYLVLMGDFIDRPKVLGDGGGAKVLETVLGLKTRYTNNVVVLKGNHEVEPVNPHEFPQEARMKYGEKDGPVIYNKYKEFFAKLPIAVKMDNGVFVTHAGAASTVRSLSDVANPSEHTKLQMVWNDPGNVRGYVTNKARGFTELDSKKAFVFGEDALELFLGAVGSKVMVRAHEQEVRHDFNGKCLTLNSTDYKNATKAYAVVDLSQEINNTNQIKINYF